MSKSSTRSNSVNVLFKTETSYHFHHPIERVWRVTRDLFLTSLISSPILYPMILEEGQDTWTEGKEFKCCIFHVGEVLGKCKKAISLPQFKKLIHEYWSPQKKYHFRVKSCLFKVTETDTTIILVKVNCFNEETGETLKQYREDFLREWNAVNEKIDHFLKDSPFHLFQYESGVINCRMEKIWDFITDFKKLKLIAPLIPLDCDCDGEELSLNKRLGKERKLYYQNHQNYLFFKTIFIQKKKNDFKWFIACELHGGEPKMEKQEIMATITKINEEDSHLGLLHKFAEPISKEKFDRLSCLKKYIIQSIKDYLENYS